MQYVEKPSGVLLARIFLSVYYILGKFFNPMERCFNVAENDFNELESGFI